MLTNKQKFFLAQSADFQKILHDDPYLNELDRTRRTSVQELDSLLEILGSQHRFGSLRVRPVTPAVWALLQCTGNHYADDISKITEEDTDQFLYLLSHEMSDLTAQGIASLSIDAKGWCGKCGLEYPEAALKLIGLIHTAFRPLEMLPKAECSSGKPDFDADWLVRLCCAAAEMSGHTLEHVMFSMPLSLVFFCFINRLRKHDAGNTIRKRTDGAAAQEIVSYVDSLGERFLREQCKQGV